VSALHMRMIYYPLQRKRDEHKPLKRAQVSKGLMWMVDGQIRIASEEWGGGWDEIKDLELYYANSSSSSFDFNMQMPLSEHTHTISIWSRANKNCLKTFRYFYIFQKCSQYKRTRARERWWGDLSFILCCCCTSHEPILKTE
jgi:hypothetical protein